MDKIYTTIFILLVAFIIFCIISYIEKGYIGIRSKEQRFIREDCPSGGKHAIKYTRLAITYQKMECSKCGKELIIDR